MSTLSDFKSKFFIIAKWAGIIIAAALGIFILIRAIFFIKEAVSPTPPPPPTASFGKLPKINFPEGIKKNFSYTIDTLSGDLPNFPDRLTVYETQKPVPDILAVERATDRVVGLGFDQRREKLSDVLYRWTSPGPLPKSLVLNINMPVFNLYSSYLTDPNVLAGANLPNEDEAISVAQEFLENLGVMPEDIDFDKTKTEFYTIDKGVIDPTPSLPGAKLISVYFFQKDIEDIPVVYPLENASVMNVVVGGGESNPQVVNARFIYQKLSEKSATYPIKTSAEAFEELKKGNAFIASYKGEDLNILIKKVYLGYLVQTHPQDYLTPVIVFEGVNDFKAYVVGVRDEWINN